MKTLKFDNRQTAEIFKDCAKVIGKMEDQEDGSVLFAYCCDEPVAVKCSQHDLEETVYRAVCNMERYMDDRVKYVHERIDRLAKILAEHSYGHLPAIKSASQMETALKNLGLDSEYTVKKGEIRVESDGNLLEARWY